MIFNYVIGPEDEDEIDELAPAEGENEERRVISPLSMPG